MELKQLRNKSDEESTERFKTVKQQLFIILDQKKILWRQRSKQLWLHSGNKNSSYFHVSASARRRSNFIHKLQNSEDDWVEWNDGLTELITNYFEVLFTTTNSECEEVIDKIPKMVTEEQNAELLKEITKEVKLALF